MGLPPVFRIRGFAPFWVGIVLSEIGTRASVAANLYQVYVLTDSTAMVGLIGLMQAVAILLLSPLGGVYADRLDRRRLLQVCQVLALAVALGLAGVTLAGDARPWHVLLSALLTMAAATFDRPARQALVPALVPRELLPQAIAVLNPSREIAVLIGPALAGLMIALGGPGIVYLFDAASYAALIVLLAFLRPGPIEGAPRVALMTALRDGVRYVRGRRIIWQLMGLDLVQTFFGAYRVLLPAIALEVLDIGPAGYGLLAAAPSMGAVLGAWAIYRLVQSPRAGQLLLAATGAYGLACVALAQSRGLTLALLAALGLGFFDALAATVRLSAVQIETPDHLRGRVTSLHQMTSRGGPALGDTNTGWVASLVGPVVALTLGGLVPVALAVSLLVWGTTLRRYTGHASHAPADGTTPHEDPAPRGTEGP